MEDKELYSYKEALEQPNWIRKLFNFVRFSQAVKFSRFVYAILVFFLLFFFFRFLRIPFNYNFIFSIILCWLIAGVLEDLKVDGRPFAFYFKDYLIFYLRYGYRENRIYINKGKVYKKIKEKGEKVESNSIERK
ncbi:TcpE family conjugal transfer membrane protein [Streptococcus acidominimus]|uniref:Conjugal transfer protein n=1 Tax=Streptococcus acidominimus TaxID=1326 RepID=A0A4Y9FRM4_STRAI|nr:TcpE family conjugal transfer membrane protein [Streptococcus acidominimus]MBF0817873.1 conjugal transfer protein [Streptococcus acidominimus]MBF0838389.1 conjugal transfer protein [Streptococcus acidominimus]MBF0846248.1 conjugal transfer protein [Streptococcus danieliae]TFU31861.1 conjugal transfer protein [Streptococcus acidominimus]